MKLENTEKPLLFSETALPDVFFVDFLSQIPGDYLKIYFGMIYCFQNTNKCWHPYPDYKFPMAIYTDEFLRETRHAIEDFRSHAHSTMLRCNSSKYFTMLPPPLKKWFYPYDSFLYKWKYIYKKLAQNKHIDFVMVSVQISDLSRPMMYADE